MTDSCMDDKGWEIARQLGDQISYDGIQWAANDKFGGYTFTDRAVTGSTFLAKNLAQARNSLNETRKRFGK